jgi:hypothetical protein
MFFCINSRIGEKVRKVSAAFSRTSTEQVTTYSKLGIIGGFGAILRTAICG